MQKTNGLLTDILTAAVLCALIFYSTMFVARKAVDSRFYRQSKIMSMLVQQESIGFAGIFEDTRNLDMLVKFTGALASAYINFEMIPVNEASTIVEIFESLPDNVYIESFKYHRKDLIIGGTADSEDVYENFLSGLRDRNYFTSVTGRSYVSTQGGIHFEIICASGAAGFPDILS